MKKDKEENHPIPEPSKVKCYICSKEDNNTKMTYEDHKKRYICDKCLDKDMKGVSYEPEIANKILREHDDIR